jgi:hypothetical protein
MYIHVCIYIYLCLRVRVRVCMCVYARARARLCFCLCTCVLIYSSLSFNYVIIELIIIFNVIMLDAFSYLFSKRDVYVIAQVSKREETRFMDGQLSEKLPKDRKIVVTTIP